MKRISLIIYLVIISFSVYSQSDSVYNFTINEAIDFALENNIKVQNSKSEIRKAKWKIWETTAIGLPQVNGTIEYQMFPDIPTQYMPDFISPAVIGVNMQMFGLTPLYPPPTEAGKFAVQFGSKHNASWGVTLSQIIFNGEYIVGLQAANTFKLLSENNLALAETELKASIKQAYYMVLIATQSKSILKQNFANLQKLLDETNKMVSVGVTEQTKADQLKILTITISNQISILERQEELATYMLKFQLGLLPEDSLVVKTTLSEVISKTNLSILQDEFNLNKNPTYQLMNTQVVMSNLGYKQQLSKTLPSLVGIYSYSQKSMKDSLNFFAKGTEWYPTSLVGLTLKVPIFGSGQKFATIQQAKIDLEITQNNKSMLEQTLNIQYIQAKNDYMSAYENMLNLELSMKLSEKIYNETQIKYKQGTASSFELTQAQNQYLQSQATYYQSLIQLFNAKTTLEKLLNY